MKVYTDPVQLFRDALAAAGQEDWNAVARLCDPVSLELFRNNALEAIRRSARTVTAEQYLEHSPGMPKEVAEYHVATANRHNDPELRLREEFPTVPSPGALEALTAAEVFAEWLRGRSPRLQLDREVREGRISVRAAAQVRRSWLNEVPMPIILGVLPDDDGIAHVAYRWQGQEHDLTAPNRDPEPAHVLRAMELRRLVQTETCRRVPDGGWHLLADYYMLGLGHSMFFHVAENDDSDNEQ
jgi:hypothetical protein